MSEIKLPEDFGKAEGNAPVAASNFGRQFEALAYSALLESKQ